MHNTNFPPCLLKVKCSNGDDDEIVRNKNRSILYFESSQTFMKQIIRKLAFSTNKLFWHKSILAFIQNVFLTKNRKGKQKKYDFGKKQERDGEWVSVWLWLIFIFPQLTPFLYDKVRFGWHSRDSLVSCRGLPFHANLAAFDLNLLKVHRNFIRFKRIWFNLKS